MENEVKQRNLQRNRRRERAQRMQAQRESKVKDGDSGEDESPAREKPPRPPARRKKSREPLAEEDIIDGFAIMAFRTYEDLEAAVKCASSPRTNALSTKPRLPLAALASDTGRNHPTNNVNSHGITLLQDAGTSDDSGRASERLTGSSVAPRDPDSSRDRLSDCDSEGDDDKASPDNSRNTSPRYHDVSMEDASDAGSLFRMTSAAGAGGKNELVARGGSGGALALSRAPVGGSASPAPAPLPQPAPSPAPAALPPPALPPPHRPNGAHIPAMDGHAAAAATQIPAKPVGAASGPSKLQSGARAAADSPTPAPPAPLFPSHAAYQPQSHAAGTALPLPDYRHTNHETRPDKPAETPPPPAPLDLHAHRAPLTRPLDPPDVEMRSPAAPAPAQPSSVPTSFPPRTTGVSPVTAPRLTPPAVPTCLPSQTLAGRPVSPAAPVSRPYLPPAIGSSHVNSSTSSSIHGHAMPPFQSPAGLQKHSVQSVYASRPSHLAPFGVPSTHPHAPTANQAAATHASHSMNSHSIASHATSHHASHPMSQPPHPPHLPPLSLPLQSAASCTATTLSSYTSTMKHPAPGIPPHAASGPPLAPPHSVHHTTAHVDLTTSCSNAPTVVTSSANSNISHPALAPPVMDTRQPIPAELPARTESPAIVSSGPATNGFPPPAVYSGTAYPPLYAPYATTLQHSPYLPPAAASPRNSADTRTSLSASPLVAPKTPKGVRPHTPGSSGAAGSALASYSPGPSPNRERESFSNISSLSRSTPSSNAPTSSALLAPSLIAPLAAPLPAPPIAVQLSGSLASLSAPQVNPLGPPLAPPLTTPLAAPTPTPAAASSSHLAHSLAPVPTVPSISSSAKPPAHWGVTPSPAEGPRGFAPAPPLFGAPLAPPNPNPFSAESLFNTSPGADLLRRELDNRFLAVAGAAGAGGVAVRTEMHHHQHQHTHVHQHPAPPPHPAAPPAPPPVAPSAATHHHPHHPHHLLVPHPPLFKDVSKMPSLYRSSMGLGYPYSSSLLHPPSPYVPPSPLSYAPAKKTGKWNAMHVRIAWEIYNHQHKDKAGGASVAPGADKDKMRAFGGVPPPAAALPPPPPLPPPPAAAYRSPYDLPPHYLPHHPHLTRYEPGPFAPHPDRALRVAGVSPFARYPPAGYGPAPPSFQLSQYSRDLALSSSLHAVHHAPLPPMHDPWRQAPRAGPGAPPPQSHAAAAAAAAAAADAARRDHEERERERERARRDREERERREREDRERRKARDLERARARSPLRNGTLEPKEERKELARHAGPPAPLSAYPGHAPPPPAAWDPYRAFDPLQHMRFAPLVEAAIRAEEDRAKMLSAYAHHQQMKAGPLVRGGALPPLGAHGLAMPPQMPQMPPLDLLKKEEPR